MSFSLRRNGLGKTKNVVGISDTIGYRNYGGLNWTILMRQPKSIAYAPLLRVQLQIGLIGAGLALVFSVLGFVLATKIVNPILKIINSANKIMSDLPSPDDTDECLTLSSSPSRDNLDLEMGSSSKDDVGVLFESLRNLVRSLDKEQELKVLNGNLEKKVRERTVELSTANKQLEEEMAERALTEAILNNMMPQSIVPRIKKGERVIADHIDNATVFFSDIVGFTDISSVTSAPEIVGLLNDIFTMMDDLAAKHNIEKIKTIGDAYFAVAGLFSLDDVKKEDRAAVYAAKVLEFSIDVYNALEDYNKLQKFRVPINFRIGIHSGPAVAGIIGFKKPFFDLWGDTINTASRMEHYGSPGRVHVSQATYELTSSMFDYELRGEIEVKGKGVMKTYWLIKKKKASARALTKVASLFNL